MQNITTSMTQLVNMYDNFRAQKFVVKTVSIFYTKSLFYKKGDFDGLYTLGPDFKLDPRCSWTRDTVEP